MKRISFCFIVIILLTAFPVFPQSFDSLAIKDTLKKYSAMPEFIPDKNKDYKILQSIPDSTIDYKIKTVPGKPVYKGVIPDTLLKKYYPKKKYKK